MSKWALWAGAVLTLTAAPSLAFAQPPLEAPSAERLVELRERAQRGEVGAQLDLGVALIGVGDGPSYAEARRWLRQAMAAGNADAKNAYAAMLLRGAGGARDEEQGRRLLLEAAAEGSVAANLTLSGIYQNGAIGFERSPVRALSHMRAAAEGRGSGAHLAQWRVGMMYLQGVGAPPDEAEAYRWVGAGLRQRPCRGHGQPRRHARARAGRSRRRCRRT